MGKIIIIDDSESVRRELRSLLESAGHLVIEGLDGTDGFKKVSENLDTDLIISDYIMPGTDGLSMLARINNENRGHKIPVFMFTAEANQSLKEEGKKQGVMAWITKPCNFEKLLVAINQVLMKKQEIRT